MGGSVLFLGLDPGYIVFRPLLIYNFSMGAIYLITGLALWRNYTAARWAAGAIFCFNALVLTSIVWIFQHQGGVATESLRAMTFRTILWLVIFLVSLKTLRPSDPLSSTNPKSAEG